MVKTKQRIFNILLVVIAIVALLFSAIGILGVNGLQASASGATESSTATNDGMSENAHTSATTYTYNYTGSQQSVTLSAGKWQLEAYGAAGGDGTAQAGGLGGYAKGTLTITANTTLYIYVGQKPTSTAGGYNGGGASIGSSGLGGGGGSDIRIGGTTLYYRVIVGGGGGGGHSDAAYTAGGGGGEKGADGVHVGSNSNHGSAPGGGTQSAGGVAGTRSSTATEPTAGSFGQGGQGGYVSNYGGGGGGGWYGGGGGTGGSSCSQGGGGGSGYVATTSSYKPSGYAVSSSYYLTDTSFGTGVQPGHGKVVITALNSPPTQSSTPTYALNRATATGNITLAGTSTSTSLMGSDSDTNNGIKLNVQGIFTAENSAASYKADAAANAWLTYTATAGNTYITGIKAARYWSGTKTFYVQVKDYNTSTNADCGATAWFKFNATCSKGTMTLGAGTPRNASSVALGNDKFNFGSSTTQVAKNAAAKGGSVFNPVGTGRQTLWLKDALNAETDVLIKVADLYTSTLSANEAVVIRSAITYGTVRYENSTTSTANAVVNTISGVSPANSSAYTDVTLTDAITTSYHNGTTTVTNYTSGYGTVKIRAKKNVPAGSYYYYFTITVDLVCKTGGTIEESKTIDVVYRVDNTRPYYVGSTTGGTTVLTGSEPLVTLTAGQTSYVDLASICKDVDGNALTIADVVVPGYEYCSVDQYGYLRKLSATSNYNKGYPNANITENSTQCTSAISAAQNMSVTTGFDSLYIYKTTGNYADTTFTSSQANTQGNSNSAYVGYYLNTASSGQTARTRLYLVGNKASRSGYAQTTTNSGGARAGHFYILIRVIDSGNVSDTGIWFPIALQVNSTKPAQVGTPSATGAVGQSYYFSPMGILSGSTYYGIGTYDETAGGTSITAGAIALNGNKSVMPLASDVDNYSYYNSAARPITVSGNTHTISASTGDATNNTYPATWAQREMIFLTANGSSTTNTSLTTTLTQSNANITDAAQGFKEFFTVQRVPLYASTSVLAGLPDTEINSLITRGIISIVYPVTSSPSTPYVRFDGLKVTLKKYTGGQYLSFYVDVTDTHNTTTTNIRVAIRVESQALNAQSVRNNEDGKTVTNFATKPNEDYPNGTIKRINDESGALLYFDYNLYINEVLRISPYDLVYNGDTYDVNTISGNNITFNTMPVTDGSSAAHTAVTQGINKTIRVNAAASATATPTATNINFKKLTIGNQSPQVLGVNTYGTVQYVAGTSSYLEHFCITATRKTPLNGYLGFDYTITTSAGDSVTIQIRIHVENSLPELREQAKASDGTKIIYLSADPALTPSNSSQAENYVTALGCFELTNSTYNVRELALSDLCEDPDGDGVRFYNGGELEVVTQKVNGDFVALTEAQNVFIKAYIAQGSNNRANEYNCLIIEGLSSTQGVPGGIWVRFKMTDDAIGTSKYREYAFQVEVYNSLPIAVSLTDDNAMEEDAEYGWMWESATERTNAVVANIFRADKTVANDLTSVIKPLYIAANEDSMEYYKAAVRKQGGNGSYFTYTRSQVRYLAEDPDAAQGMSLFAYDYKGGNDDAPTFNFITPTTEFDAGSAVAITPFYDPNLTLEYYKQNNIVQIIFFDDAGNRIDTETSDSTALTEANAKAHRATHWVIAFNFLGEAPTSAFKVMVRMRDSNGALVMPTGTPAATAGGHTVEPKTPLAYEGRRVVKSNQFAPNTTLLKLYGANGSDDGHGTFTFGIRLRSQGLYDNFSKWSASNQTEIGGKTQDISNVWYAQDNAAQNHYYQRFDTSITDASELFSYSTITVPEDAEKESAAVPLSYFAWVADNVSNDARHNVTAQGTSAKTAQSRAAWFNVTTGEDSEGDPIYENQTLNTALSTGITLESIAKAITLKDGRNVWTGEHLNDNPYITFDLFRQADLSASGNDNRYKKEGTTEYLYGQQRFSITQNEETNQTIYNIFNPELTQEQAAASGASAYTGAYFIEDQFGLSMTKREVRSVNTLTLTVDISLWLRSGGTYVNDAANDASNNRVTVTVPVFVENSPLNIKNEKNNSVEREYNFTSTISYSGFAVALVTSDEDKTYNTKTTYIELADQADQVVSESIVTGTTVYREDMYVLANSLQGNFSAEQLDHMRSKRAKLVDGAQERLAAYFGVTDLDDAFDNAGGLSAAASINPHYTDYFTFSPSAVDSKLFTIVPTHQTTFRYGSEASRADIEKEAEERGLQVVFDEEDNVEYMYYAFRVIVYDRLTVGASSNSTDFTDSSYDVITINIRIENSAPTVLSRNMSEKVDIGDGTEGGYYARRVTLTRLQSVTYNFADLFSDVDMVVNVNTNNYYTRQEIFNDDTYSAANLPNMTAEERAAYKKLTQDTADYPLADASGKLVTTRFLSVNGKPTNEWTSGNQTGAVSCDVDAETGAITVTVRNRANGYSTTDIVSYIMVGFSDRSGQTARMIIAVCIGNAAPTLTEEAESVMSVNMHTGEYFTLYTTPWSRFISGAGISTTVGDATHDAASPYSGTYFSDMKTNDVWNSSQLSSRDREIASWTYAQGPYSTAGKYDYGTMQNLAIGIDEYVDYHKTQDKANKLNLGYMAIADDDAPWTLRIDQYADEYNGVYVSNTQKIRATQLNRTLYEGAGNTTYYGYTAVMFEAIGACTDVTVSITLTDGVQALDGGTQRSVTYSFKISVESTGPSAITESQTNGSTLASSLGGTGYEGRVSHVRTEQSAGDSATGNVYDLKMFVGESITLKTSDFATDIDQGDEELLYLFSNGTAGPFLISSTENTSGVYTDHTRNMTVTHRSGNANTANSTQFTVTALNFHNETASTSDLYDEIQFYIVDPFYADTAAGHAIRVQLRVYVYPAEVKAVSSNPATVEVRSVAQSQTEGAYAVPLVTATAKEGGLITDRDVAASRTRYSVSLYTLLYDENGTCKNYALKDFLALSSAERDAQLMATYTFTTVDGTPKLSEVRTGNAALAYAYIQSVTFSGDGSMMYIMPRSATNGVEQLADRPKSEGFCLYAVVDKLVNRSSGGDYGPGFATEPAYGAGVFLNVTVGNTAPTAVGDTAYNYNLRKDGHTYRTVVGKYGDVWSYYLYNLLTMKDEALFVDPDGDHLVYAGAEIANVYTFNEAGNRVSHMNVQGVLETAKRAFAITSTDALEYVDGTQTATYSGFWISITDKLDIRGYTDQTVYIDLQISVHDADENSVATTIITLGINNSAPVFKTSEGIGEAYHTKGNTYTMNEATGDAELRLTLSADDSEMYGSKGGEIIVPLADLIDDADYRPEEKDNSERFTLVKTSPLSEAVELYELDGDPTRMIWVEDGEGDYTSDAETAASKRFSVRVSDGNNTALIFSVHSYERGASEEVRVRIADASGEQTGILTVVLTIGNSAPVDRTAEDDVSNTIILAGGKTGNANNNTFTPTRFELSEYARDNNPADNAGAGEREENEVSTYLRIMGYTIDLVQFDGASNFDGYLGGDSGDEEGTTLTQPVALVDLVAYETYFTVAPLVNLYGRQVITLAVTDAGNSDAVDSVIIYIQLIIQITKNPDDLEINDIEVYWRRSVEITAHDLYYKVKDAENVSDESDGMKVISLEIKSNPGNSISILHENGTENWGVFGESNQSRAVVTAGIIVGNTVEESAKIWYKDFNVIVNDNKQPEYKINLDTGEVYNKHTVYIPKSEMDRDGVWVVPITYFFVDNEDDEIKVETVSIDKTLLITVEKGENNTLVFRFKSRGDGMVTLKLSDAVSTYDYTFRIGNEDLPEPNFFIGVIADIQENPWTFIGICVGVVLLLLILIGIVAAANKKKQLRAEVEAMLVSEMELEERMLYLAAGEQAPRYSELLYLQPSEEDIKKQQEEQQQQVQNAAAYPPMAGLVQPNVPTGSDVPGLAAPQEQSPNPSPDTLLPPPNSENGSN